MHVHLLSSTVVAIMAPGRPRSLRTLAFGASRRDSSPSAVRSPSPTFSDATHASAMNFGANGPEKIITRADLKASIQAYEEVRPPDSRPGRGAYLALVNGE